ncbi:MAG: hypothetical protein II977_01420 [Oscillospiraceae bacterium]|nr:hypothetical protein [Oscillospiraceae bacterium]
MTKEKDNKIEKAKVDFEKDMIEVEQAEKERKTYSAKKGKKNDKVRTRRIVTGGVFCFLALVGLVSIITNIFSLGVKIVDNEGEKQEYNNLLTTLVVYDPLPFESPDQADQQMLLASSVWAAIMNEDMSIYETDEYGYTLLPAVDVDKYFSKVFGTGIKLEHGSFSDRDVEFEFNKEKQAYVVPATNFPTGFTPQVEKIKKTFTEKIVTVGYLSPSNSWADTTGGALSKYVDYIFEKQDGQFALVAVRESAMKVELPEATPAPDAQN